MTKSKKQNIMRSAVVVASYAPNEAALVQVRAWFDAFVHFGYGVCDVYVGVNPSPCSDLLLDVLKKDYANKFASLEAAVVTDPKLVVNSDVSGYQKGLELLYKSDKRYDVVWMVHTKGVSYPTNSHMWQLARNLMIEVLARKGEVESLFEKNQGLGTWSPYLTVCSAHRRDFDAFFDFRYPVLPVFCVYTFAAFNGNALATFLEEASHRGFFEVNLPANAGFDQSARWFFEFAMGQMVWRQGYSLAYTKLVDWAFWQKGDQKDLLMPQEKLGATRDNVINLFLLNRQYVDPVEAVARVRASLNNSGSTLAT